MYTHGSMHMRPRLMTHVIKVTAPPISEICVIRFKSHSDSVCNIDCHNNWVLLGCWFVMNIYTLSFGYIKINNGSVYHMCHYVRVLEQLINLAFKTPMMFSFIENYICLEKTHYGIKYSQRFNRVKCIKYYGK